LLAAQRTAPERAVASLLLSAIATGLSALTRATEVQPEMAKEVLRYFVHNPHAADSLEGVARWRLLEEAVRRHVEGTQLALTWLVAQGFLREVSSPGIGPIFSLNPEKRGEAERFLNLAPGRTKSGGG
jgi:uncharacterized membrane protein YidH (DUF202 family)